MNSGARTIPVQIQFANHVFHPGKIQALTKVEILNQGGAEHNLHAAGHWSNWAW